MEVKIKKLSPNAVIPQYAHDTDAGMDLTAISRYRDEKGNVVYGTGLAFEIPDGYVGLLFPRSSNSKKDLVLTNSVGVIDSGYRGEVTFKFRPICAEWHNEDRSVYYPSDSLYEIGDRIGQIIIMPYPHINFVETDELTKTDRGEGGYGSTGK